MRYHGRAVEWIKAQLGWTVRRSLNACRSGGRYFRPRRTAPDASVDDTAAEVGRRAHFRLARTLPPDEPGLRVPDRGERSVHLCRDGPADARKGWRERQ